jgi:hypothetical protein
VEPCICGSTPELGEYDPLFTSTSNGPRSWCARPELFDR